EEKGLTLKSDLETLALKIEELRRRQSDNSNKIRELTEHEHSSICPLCSSAIVDRAAVINRYRSENDEFDREISALKDGIVSMELERGELRRRYQVLRKELDGRKDLDLQIGKFNEKLEAIKRAEEQLQRIRSSSDQISARLDKQDYAQVERESLIGIKAEIYKLDFDPVIFSNVQSQIRAKRYIESRYQKLQRDRDELIKAESELPKIKEKVTLVSDQLASESYGQEIREELQKVQKLLDDLGYDREEHGKLRQKLEELLPTIERYRDLKRAVETKPQLEESASISRRLLESKQEQIMRLEQESQALLEKVSTANVLTEKLAEEQTRLTALRAEKEELGKRLAVVSAAHDQLRLKLSQFTEQKNELKRTQSEQEDFAILAEAFGKKGIQAIIIENAIPEIEEEANRILSRLTENKMHIGLVTQDKNKSGSLIETLDLVIGDEIGTRNYELYSGGEAFKVNFAVRVALSKLLARRSGAKLETLIIDEGFGSQDDVSRDKLVTAIRSIQSDFARILVITHIQEIREMFPAQIQVSKEQGSSKIRLVF
ncbi:MAG TPA: SMC family ATPase, partial [Chroococcales cyanobacterium]